MAPPHDPEEGAVMAAELVAVATRIAGGVTDLPVSELDGLLARYRTALRVWNTWCSQVPDDAEGDVLALRHDTNSTIQRLRTRLIGNRVLDRSRAQGM